MRLVTRFVLVMSAVVTFLVASISFTLIHREKAELTREAGRRAMVLVDTLSLGLNSATFLERRDLLVDYFDRLVPASEGQILYVLITSLDGLAWLDTLKEHEYQLLQDPLSQEIGRRLRTEKKMAHQFFHPTLKEEVLEVAAPIVGQGMDRGILRIGFSLKPLRDQIRRALWNAVLIGFISLFVGIGLSVFLAGGVARPIARVVQYAREVAAGNLSLPMRKTSGSREMQELARAIERMKRDLKYVYIGGLFRDLSHTLKSDLGYCYAELERMRASGQGVAPLIARLDRMTAELEKFKTLQKPADLKKVSLATAPFLLRFVDQLPSQLKNCLEVQLPADLPPIYGDPIYLERALTHLLKNASEASRNGEKILLRVFPEDKQLSIQIADQGVGIDEADLPHVFDPGFTTKRGQGGEGLGLAFSQMIVEEIHGGKISVASRRGEGCRVTLAHPLEVA